MPISAGSWVNVSLRKNNTLAVTYCLLILLSRPKQIVIGRLGTFSFKRVNYIYVGSAKRNIEKRIERHLRKKKRKFWHIDYLLQYARIKRVLVSNLSEERIAAMLSAKMEIPVEKFGASDKKSESHLFFSTKGELFSDYPLSLLTEIKKGL